MGQHVKCAFLALLLPVTAWAATPGGSASAAAAFTVVAVSMPTSQLPSTRPCGVR
jgi:hypothetical protein